MKFSLAFLLMFSFARIGKAQSIIFDFADADNSAIVFQGETNLTMRCEVLNSRNAFIEIVLGRETLANNDMEGFVVEYVIPEVTLQDSGHYTCLVTRDLIDGGTITEGTNLELKVDTTRPKCILDGPERDSYRSGEMLLLSCYCMVMDNCQWSTFEVTANESEHINGQESLSFGVKVIVRLSVGPLSESDNDTIFQCAYGPSPSEQCSIGPFNVIPQELESTNTAENDVTKPNQSPGSSSKRRPNFIFVIIIIAISVLLLITLLGLSLFLLVASSLRKRNVKPGNDNLRNEGEYAMIETDFSAQSEVAAGKEGQAPLKKPTKIKQSEDAYEVPRKPRRGDMIPDPPDISPSKTRLLPDTPNK